MSVTLLIPALNEIEGLKLTLPQIDRTGIDQLLLVDGGSLDGTAAYAASQGLEVLVQRERGYVAAMKEGLRACKGDIVVVFSPDGNCDPSCIPLLIQRAQAGDDMVIASRYYQGTRSEDDTPLTSFGNWMFTFLINVFFSGHLTDSLVNYRAYRRRLVDAFLNSNQIYDSVEPWFSVIALKNGYQVSEILGREAKRAHGVRKTPIFKPGINILVLIACEFGSSLRKKFATFLRMQG